ncbi:MAG: hypothetical protein WAN81_08425 [Candidatus Binataceae bacterium]
MARLEQRHEGFLVNVFDFIHRDARAQETGDCRTDIVEQKPAGIGVTLLQALHQTRAQPAALEPLSVVDLFHSCGTAICLIGFGAEAAPLALDARFGRIRTARSAACRNKCRRRKTSAAGARQIHACAYAPGRQMRGRLRERLQRSLREPLIDRGNQSSSARASVTDSARRSDDNRLNARDEIVEACSAGTVDHQPEIAKRVQRLVQFDEIIETRDVPQVNRQYRDGHIDYHRYRNDSRAEANDRQRAADQLRIGAQRRVEGGMRNPPLSEALREAVEVVRLRPSGFEEKISDEKDESVAAATNRFDCRFDR